MHNRFLGMATTLVLALISGHAASQDIVYRELAAKGVKALTGDEVKQALGGAKLTVPVGSANVSLQFEADGTLGGSVETSRGSAGLVGTWTINDKHQYCWEYRVTVANVSGNGCRRLFRSGEDLYTGISGQGQDAVMRKLELAK